MDISVPNQKDINMENKAIILSRVSSEHQTLEQQTEAVLKEVRRDGYTDDNIIIIEDKESAIKLSEEERNGLNKMKEYINNDPSINVATKIEAVRGRGGEDLRFSHDFEDLVYVLNNRQDITELFDNENDSDLTGYLSSWAKEMLSRQNCREEIECMLPYGDYDRVDYIIEILNHFSR